MKMPATRLFIGGLSKTVNQEVLRSQLSQYGAVGDIDLKEKTDVDGNVVVRFAYVNIEANSSQIDACIRQLSRASVLGSQVRVEPAKESFLDRLKRERASQPPRQHPESQDKSEKDEPSVLAPGTVIENERKSKKFRKYSITAEEVTLEIKETKKKKFRQTSEQSEPEEQVFEQAAPVSDKKKKRSKDKVSSDNTEASPMLNPKTKKKNKVEEEILSSFKSFSSVWADSDSEDGEGSAVPGEARSSTACGSTDPQDLTLGPVRNSASVKKSSIVKRTNLKESVSDSVSNSGESDTTINDDAEPAPNLTDAKVELRAQLDVFDKLEGSPSMPVHSDNYAAAQPITRYDPTHPDHQQFRLTSTAEKDEQVSTTTKDKYVRVAKDLSFGQTSSGFSLLAQFSQQRQETSYAMEEEEDLSAPVVVPLRPIVVPAQRNVKERPFFVASDDMMVEDAISWMSQSLTPEIKEEFEDVQPELKELYKTRAIRAMRELRDTRGRGRGRSRGRSRGRNRGWGFGQVPMTVRGKPHRDHRWRESSS